MTATTKDFKKALRTPYAWPGGYEKALYFQDGERICVPCAKENFKLIIDATRDAASSDPRYRDSWVFGRVQIYWEGPPESCVQCNKELKSEYGDPNGGGQ